MIIGAVLAGGLSSRMGQDKALLRMGAAADGATLLVHTGQTLWSAGCEEVWLSGESRAEWPTAWGRTVPDPVTGAGPVAALAALVKAAALVEAQTPPVLLIVPVDMPSLRAATLARLCEALCCGDSDAAMFKGHPLPLALRITEAVKTRAAEALAAVLAGEDVAIRRYFLATLKLLSLPMEESLDADFQNVNTPDEWARFNQRCGDVL